jgi:immunoglobulin-like protein involved in spore germination/sporulation and spore germination protein
MSRHDKNWGDEEWPDDGAARRLRDVLGNEASSVQPSGDGLARIREKIRERRSARRAWLRPLAVAGAAAATAAVVVAVVLIAPSGGGNHQVLPGADSSATTQVVNPAPSSSAPVSPSAAPSHAVTLYFVGAKADPQQLLYPETVMRVPPADNAFISDAVTALLTTPPTDPDYVNGWPQGTQLLGATIKNDTEAIIDLSPEAANGPKGLGEISAQQLFYTVHGAAPKIDSLELRIGGQPVTSLWGAPITDPITPKEPFEVFAHVWITSPTQGATVASAVTFGGDAIVFEANVSWQILMNGSVLKQGFATASAGAPMQGTWQDSVTLTPGTYELRAFETSAKDGSPTYVDTKTFTVN